VVVVVAPEALATAKAATRRTWSTFIASGECD